jgi:uncharacterized protein with von Willebrand factor type A (vWA) domain
MIIAILAFILLIEGIFMPRLEIETNPYYKHYFIAYNLLFKNKRERDSFKILTKKLF